MKARAGPPVEKNICDLMEMAGTEKARVSFPGLSVLAWSEGGSGLRDVRCLGSLLSLNDLEFDAIALGQRLEAFGLDRAEVDEDVRTSFTGDESVTLRVVEPLHCAGDACHGALPLPSRG